MKKRSDSMRTSRASELPKRCRLRQKSLQIATLASGFTLMELTVVLAVVAIFSSIAFPSYSQYTKRQRIRAAQADLMALVLNMENQYALSKPISYPAATNSTESTVQTFNGVWTPTQSSHFKFEIQQSDTTSYKIRAVGISASVDGCEISIDNKNARTLSSACGGGLD